MKKPTRDWSAIIQAHEAAYKATDRSEDEKALSYYNGLFYGERSHRNRESGRLAYNLIYIVVETAVAQLVPANPRVSPEPEGPTDPQLVRDADAVVNRMLKLSQIRREAVYAITNAVLKRRGIFKTTLRDGRARVRSIDPQNLWFDLSAKRLEDCRYFVEVAPTPVSVVERKMKRRGRKRALYTKRDVSGTDYPAWMRGDTTSSSQRKLQDAERWVIIYEVYDLEYDEVFHLCSDDLSRPLLADTLDYRPYSIFSMNWNAKNLEGLSEVGLILSLQEEVNSILSRWMQIAHKQVDRYFFDARKTTVEQLSNALETSAGGMAPATPPEGMTLAQMFHRVPGPVFTAEQMGLLARLEQIISTVSALAEAARGQVSGARTATEIALIDGNLQTRLTTRKDNFGDALADVAGIILDLMSRYGDPLPVPVTGPPRNEEEAELASEYGENWREATGSDWREVDPQQLADAALRFDMIPYSPIRSNAAVRAEAFLALLPHLRASENYDQRAIDKQLLEVGQLPPELLKAADDIGANGDPAQLALQLAQTLQGTPLEPQAIQLAQALAEMLGLLPPSGEGAPADPMAADPMAEAMAAEAMAAEAMAAEAPANPGQTSPAMRAMMTADTQGLQPVTTPQVAANLPSAQQAADDAAAFGGMEV
jgi:hypothetical protein